MKIDELVVEAILDSKKFKAGLRDAMESMRSTKEAAQQNTKKFEELAERGIKFLSRFKTMALGIGATLIGAASIKELVEKFVPMNAALGRTAHYLQMSAKELLVWESAGQRVGAEAGEITANFQRLQSQLSAFQRGETSELPGLFRLLGIDPRDAQKGIKTVDDLMRALAPRMSGVEARRAYGILRDRMGLSEGMVNLLQKGQGLEAFLEQSRQLVVLTKEQTDAAQQLQDKWGQLKTAMESLGNAFNTQLTGPMDQFLDVLLKIVKNSTNLIDQKVNPNKITPEQQHILDMRDRFNNFILGWTKIFSRPKTTPIVAPNMVKSLEGEQHDLYGSDRARLIGQFNTLRSVLPPITNNNRTSSSTINIEHVHVNANNAEQLQRGLEARAAKLRQLAGPANSN